MKDIKTGDGKKPEEIAEEYVKKIRSLFTDVQEKRSSSKHNSDFSEISLKNKKGAISIWYDRYAIGITIEGADTGHWNTSEDDDVDIYFWFAVGVLRNGIRYRKPLIGFQQAWIYSDENKIWAVVPKKYHAYGYTKFKDKFPNDK